MLGGAAAMTLLGGHGLLACELSQRPKPAAHVERKWIGLADLQKRLADLLRPGQASSQPSRRIILQ